MTWGHLLSQMSRRMGTSINLSLYGLACPQGQEAGPLLAEHSARFLYVLYEGFHLELGSGSLCLYLGGPTAQLPKDGLAKPKLMSSHFLLLPTVYYPPPPCTSLLVRNRGTRVSQFPLPWLPLVWALCGQAMLFRLPQGHSFHRSGGSPQMRKS